MFSHSIRLFDILGFQIKVDPSWLLIAALIVWSLSSGYFPQVAPGLETPAYVALAVVAMLGLFASLILHELSHSLVARRFGLGIGGITLFLFGGVAELQDEPESARSEFWVAAAGPAMSFLLAGLGWIGWQLAASLAPGSSTAALLQYLWTINLILAVFNLLPAFPLDGGRVFRAWLWSRSGDLLGATEQASRVGVVLATGLMLFGILSVLAGGGIGGLWLVLIGLFVLNASRSAHAQLTVKIGLQGRTVRDLMTTDPHCATAEMTLDEVANGVMLAHAVSWVPIVEQGVLLGHVDSHAMRSVPRADWPRTRAADIMTPAGPENTVAPDLPAMEALRRLSEGRQRKFMVAEGRSLVGILSLRDMLGFIAVMQELQAPRPGQR